MGQVFEAVAEKVIEKNSRNKDKPQAAKKPAAENLKLGRTVLIIAIIVSLLVIAPVKLSGKRASVMKVFKNGTEKEYTVSVYHDIMLTADYASDLVNIADAAKGADKDDVKQLRKLVEDIQTEDDEQKLLALFAELVAVSDKVYQQYANMNNVSYEAETAHNNINNKMRTVTNDSFWGTAREFNAMRNAFPARILAWFANIDEVPEYFR